MMKYLIMLSIFCLLLYACISKECQIAGGYLFEIPVTLSPAKDTFNIGDTITISSIFSNNIYEKKTNLWYMLDSFKFYPETFVYKTDTIGALPDVLDFGIVIEPKYNYYVFSYSDGGNSLIGQYNYENNEYSLMYKIIPKFKGTYSLAHSSAIFGLGENQDFDGKCKCVTSDVDTKMNGGGDNNVDFLQNSPDEIFQNIWERQDAQFHRFGGYCFHVK